MAVAYSKCARCRPAAVAILKLAIGIGANTVIFSQVNAVLFEMLRVKDRGQLQQLGWTSPKNGFASSIRGSNHRNHNGEEISGRFSYSAYVAIRDASRGSSDVICQNIIGCSGLPKMIRSLLQARPWFSSGSPRSLRSLRQKRASKIDPLKALRYD